MNGQCQGIITLTLVKNGKEDFKTIEMGERDGTQPQIKRDKKGLIHSQQAE